MRIFIFIALLIYSWNSSAEQFVVIADVNLYPKSYNSGRYIFSAEPIRIGSKIYGVYIGDTYNELSSTSIVKSSINYDTFIKEVDVTVNEHVKKIKGWKYIYRAAPFSYDDRVIVEMSSLGFEGESKKLGDVIKKSYLLLPKSVNYSIKDTANCPKRPGITTVKWGQHKLSYLSECPFE